jgi:hypothetical protein
MATLSIAICAHISRTAMAEALQDQLDCPVSMDDGSIGCSFNHDEAFKLAAQTPADWMICIEDDAQPVPDFREQASMALAACPRAYPVVSLYFGYIGDSSHFAPHIDIDAIDAHWLIMPALASTVCLCVRGDFFPGFFKIAENLPHMTSDQRYESAARQLHVEDIAYSWPSLVNHDDTKTVHYTGAPHVPRRAYRVGSREQWDGSVAS